VSSGKLAEMTTARAEVQKRSSGPLLDRFDIHVDVPRVDYEKLASDRAGESSEAVRQRVLSARERQLARFDGSGLTCNADTPARHRKRSRAVQVWARRTSANIASWTRRAKP
jgi:predicted ATPase with chaperone activity